MTNVFIHRGRRRARDYEPDTTLREGEKIRLNRQGAQIETVVSQRGNMVTTNKGNSYHVTKVVAADARDAENWSFTDPKRPLFGPEYQAIKARADAAMKEARKAIEALEDNGNLNKGQHIHDDTCDCERTKDAGWSFQKWMQMAEAELMRLHGFDPTDLRYDWRQAWENGVAVRVAVDRAAMGAKV